MINDKIIDTHMHIEAWENEEYNFIDCFEGHREQAGLKSLNICVVPTKERNFCNNIMCAFYKLAHPNTYIHGGFDHMFYPITENMPKGMDLVTQYKELMEIGFDGIKLIEGKPTCLKPLGNDLNHPMLDKLYTEMEKDGTHIVFHINDPDYFWDENSVKNGRIPEKWLYAEGHLTQEQIYKQADKLFENHPMLKATLAHFFFCSKTPEKVIELFEKYPNLCVDLTPGTEMYHDFEANHQYYRDFFRKYSDRVLVGTDGTFPWLTHTHVWCIEVLYSFIATENKIMAFDDSILSGLGIDGEAKENILYKNFERRVGQSPKPINKAALKSYIDKHMHLLSDEAKNRLIPLYEKYL